MRLMSRAHGVHDEMNGMSLSSPCPCNPDKTYSQCCKPLHEGTPAPTAEALMRSRYSAYVLELSEYLLSSWHPSTRPPVLELESTKWLGLTVKAFSLTGDTAGVEFVARYKVQGKAYRLHEKSRFVREQSRWFYVDGDIEA
jgi:SEC-C motif-containing protein